MQIGREPVLKLEVVTLNDGTIRVYLKH